MNEKNRKPFDPSRAAPMSLVSYQDIAEYAGLSPAYLRKLKWQGKFIAAHISRGSYVRFLWWKAKAWVEGQR